MKAKISRGSGFRGALSYALDQGKHPELVGGTMTGTTPRALAAEFKASREMRPDVEKPVWHCSLSLPKGERIDSEKWQQIADDYMQEMGMADHQYVVIRHSDTEHDHAHIIASRIALDGKLWHGQWEARRAIEATQELEQRHGLSLTPGLTEPREHKALSKGEIEMALRTGNEPPRQKLARLVDEAKQGNPTAPQFAERLTVAGVTVHANIASTGRMNGFSYELDGVAFKSSQLGKAYTWSQLQKEVNYEQTRDREGLERFRPPAPNPRAVADLERGSESTPRGDLERDSLRDRTALDAQRAGAEDHRELRPDHKAPTLDARRPDRGNDRAGLQVVSGTSPSPSGVDRSPHATTEEDRDGNAPGERVSETDQHRPAPALEDSQPARSDSRSDPAPMVEDRDHADRDSDTSRRPRPDWSLRFRQASAAKRNSAERTDTRKAVAERDAPRARIDAGNIAEARSIDPTPFLQAHGYEVVRDGQRHLSVKSNGDELYRITQKPDGHYVWCDLYGNQGGDNIDLVKEIQGPRTGFAEAVYQLSGGPSITPPQPRPAPELRSDPPKLPKGNEQDRHNGREYLKARGIDEQTLDHAEKTGFLQHVKGAVVFVGLKAGEVWNATRRAISADDPVQKRDLRGSDKSAPAILQGDPKKIWIVEGGTDALALHAAARRQGNEPPTAIVSGGSGVRSWLENPAIKAMLMGASKITVAAEREKDRKTQDRTDEQRQKQIERIRDYAPITQLDVWQPGPGIKDLAEWNKQAADLAADRQRQQDRMNLLKMQRETAIREAQRLNSRSTPAQVYAKEAQAVLAIPGAKDLSQQEVDYHVAVRLMKTGDYSAEDTAEAIKTGSPALPDDAYTRQVMQAAQQRPEVQSAQREREQSQSRGPTMGRGREYELER